MAIITWVGGSSNNFNDKLNWSPQSVPVATSDVVIAPVAATSIIAANDTINSLTTNANTTLSVTATDTFTILDRSTAQTPTGTSINGGTLLLNSACDLFLSGTFDNTGALTTQAASDVWLTGTLLNTGTVNQRGDFNVGNSTTAGRVVNNAGGHWTITGNVDVVNGGAAGSTLSNVGTLARAYSDQAVVIDTSTVNPARLIGLPGTRKAKGSPRPDRPWRLVTLDGIGPGANAPG